MATDLLELQMEWKSWHITRLGLPAELENDLDDDGVVTLGELLESEDYSDDPEVVAGFGRFYENYPQFAQQEEAIAEEDASLDPKDMRLKHYRQITSLNEQWYAAQVEFLDASRIAKELKKKCDAIGSDLQRMIRGGPDKQRKLFEDSTCACIDPEAEVVDDQWRAAEIGKALGLTNSQFEKLQEAGVTNMGQFEDLRGGAGLSSIKGVGQALSDTLEDRALEWLNDNRDHLGAAVDTVSGKGA